MTIRERWRLAQRIVRRLNANPPAHNNAAQALGTLLMWLEPLSRHHRLMRTCRRNGWHIAYASLESRLNHLLNPMLTQANHLRYDQREPLTSPLSERAVYEELDQLGEEFGGFTFDAESQILAVTTDRIRLEGVDLGPFQIQLRISDLGQLGSRRVYKVIATDPSCPEGNESITHPHVSDDVLCEGEASPSIRAALSQSRLCDFFLLVRGVLQTYNPDSPYVRLDSWHGSPCRECGSSMGDEDRHYCDSCDNEFCDDCICVCDRCGDRYCPGCIKRCEFCKQSVCASCLIACNRCGQGACTHCSDNDLCPDCKDRDEETQDEDPDQLEPPPPPEVGEGGTTEPAEPRETAA